MKEIANIIWCVQRFLRSSPVIQNQSGQMVCIVTFHIPMGLNVPPLPPHLAHLSSESAPSRSRDSLTSQVARTSPLQNVGVKTYFRGYRTTQHTIRRTEQSSKPHKVSTAFSFGAPNGVLRSSTSAKCFL